MSEERIDFSIDIIGEEKVDKLVKDMEKLEKAKAGAEKSISKGASKSVERKTLKMISNIDKKTKELRKELENAERSVKKERERSIRKSIKLRETNENYRTYYPSMRGFKNYKKQERVRINAKRIEESQRFMSEKRTNSSIDIIGEGKVDKLVKDMKELEKAKLGAEKSLTKGASKSIERKTLKMISNIDKKTKELKRELELAEISVNKERKRNIRKSMKLRETNEMYRTSYPSARAFKSYKKEERRMIKAEKIEESKRFMKDNFFTGTQTKNQTNFLPSKKGKIDYENAQKAELLKVAYEKRKNALLEKINEIKKSRESEKLAKKRYKDAQKEHKARMSTEAKISAVASKGGTTRRSGASFSNPLSMRKVMGFGGGLMMANYMGSMAKQATLEFGSEMAEVERNVIRSKSYRQSISSDEVQTSGFNEATKLFTKLTGTGSLRSDSTIAEIGGLLASNKVNIKDDTLTNAVKAIRALSFTQGMTTETATDRVIGVATGRTSPSKAGLIGFKRSTDPAKTIENIYKFLKKNPLTEVALKEDSMQAMMTTITTARETMMGRLYGAFPNATKGIMSPIRDFVRDLYGAGEDTEALKNWATLLVTVRDEINKTFTTENADKFSEYIARTGSLFAKAIGASVRNPKTAMAISFAGASIATHIFKSLPGWLAGAGAHIFKSLPGWLAGAGAGATVLGAPVAPLAVGALALGGAMYYGYKNRPNTSGTYFGGGGGSSWGDEDMAPRKGAYNIYTHTLSFDRSGGMEFDNNINISTSGGFNY